MSSNNNSRGSRTTRSSLRRQQEEEQRERRQQQRISLASTAPSTPIQSIIRSSQANGNGSSSSSKSVKFNFDRNTYRSTFCCVGCLGLFSENEVEKLNCGHHICVACAVDIMCGEIRNEGLTRCSCCKTLLAGNAEWDRMEEIEGKDKLEGRQRGDGEDEQEDKGRVDEQGKNEAADGENEEQE